MAEVSHEEAGNAITARSPPSNDIGWFPTRGARLSDAPRVLLHGLVPRGVILLLRGKSDLAKRHRDAICRTFTIANAVSDKATLNGECALEIGDTIVVRLEVRFFFHLLQANQLAESRAASVPRHSSYLRTMSSALTALKWLGVDWNSAQVLPKRSSSAATMVSIWEQRSEPSG